MPYRARFYPNYKKRLLKEIADARNKKVKTKKGNINTNTATFLTNPRDIQNFIWTHSVSNEELR